MNKKRAGLISRPLLYSFLQNTHQFTGGMNGEKEYRSNSVPVGTKFQNTPQLAAGIGILRNCHLFDTGV
jgi:hypothetical protein